MPGDRGGRNDLRQRREFQRISFGPYTIGDGVDLDLDTMTIAVDLVSNAGLEFIAGDLAVNVDENFGLSLNSSGVRIDLLSSGGLEFSGGDLAVNVDENFGLSLNSSGIRVDIASNAGLEFSSGNLAVNVDENFGLSLNSTGIRVDIASTSGLEFSSGDLRIDIDNEFLKITPNGLGSSYVTVTGGGVDVDFAAPGHMVFSAGSSDLQLYAFNADIYFEAANNLFATTLFGNMILNGTTGVTISSDNSVVINAGAGINMLAAGNKIFDADATGLSFFGSAPVAQQGGFTITAAPAVATALNADANAGAAYTATPIALLNAATLADLNDLRGDVQSLAAVLRKLIKSLGTTSGSALISDSGY